ncbi:4bcd3a21-bf75-45ae-aa0b-d8ef6e98a830 [Thermothielavioides terrestris]|uniref:4bcd3a21-bf75-45ae-aa0b-d8ef6e98a830 n=1 Tax=Thermothielavioides terrestris TaxID=2587410 RepID=A0A3S4AUA9_9PEZI|nr:4bcd3a21-bf75-45ae-aa0b-d8ef6e98a830 [Thermothielavioides terrestris]
MASYWMRSTFDEASLLLELLGHCILGFLPLLIASWTKPYALVLGACGFLSHYLMQTFTAWQLFWIYTAIGIAHWVALADIDVMAPPRVSRGEFSHRGCIYGLHISTVVEAGWGQRHPLCANDKRWFRFLFQGIWERPLPVPEGLTLIYAPRDALELQALDVILRAAIWAESLDGADPLAPSGKHNVWGMPDDAAVWQGDYDTPKPVDVLFPPSPHRSNRCTTGTTTSDPNRRMPPSDASSFRGSSATTLIATSPATLKAVPRDTFPASAQAKEDEQAPYQQIPGTTEGDGPPSPPPTCPNREKINGLSESNPFWEVGGLHMPPENAAADRVGADKHAGTRHRPLAGRDEGENADGDHDLIIMEAGADFTEDDFF